MRYWIFDGRDAQGPFTEEELRRQPGFSLETLICPDGAASADQWKPARQYLPAGAPAPSPSAAPKPAAAAPKPAAAAPAASPAPRAEPKPAPSAEAKPAASAEPKPEPKPQPQPDLRPEPRGPMAEARSPLVEPRGPMSRPAPETPAGGGMGQLGRLKPEPAGESPEAIRLRKAAELPARKTDPDPEPPPPEPPPPDRRGEQLKKAALALAALALLASGFYGGRALLRRRRLRLAAAAAAAPAPAPAAAAPDAAGAADQQPAGDAAIALVKSFPVESKGRKRPTGPSDVLTQKAWRPASTLGELYDQMTLEALALEAAASAERQGHSVAEGEREIRRSPQLWAQRAQRFLSKSAPSWSVELNGRIWRVMVSLPARPGEPPRRFDVDLAARTLKPADQLSWFDVDPKEAARWGGKYLRLSEEPDQPDGGGPQTPTYRAPAAPGQPAAVAAKAPSPASLDDDMDYSDPEAEPAKPAAAAPARISRAAPPKRVARTAAGKAAPKAKPAPEETYDDPDAKSDDDKAVQTIFSDSDNANNRPEPKPLSPSASASPRTASAEPAPAPAPAARPPLPALDGQPSAPRPGGEGTIMTPQPSSGGSGSSGGQKSVTDMSVDELQKYLNRDNK